MNDMIAVMLVIACWQLASICNAVMDVLAFKYKTSIFKDYNPDWWNPARSWRNKYKDKDPRKGPAFLGSTTMFSFTTDAWHMFQFLSNSLIVLSIVILLNQVFELTFWKSVILFFVFKAMWGITFEIFYSRVFRHG